MVLVSVGDSLQHHQWGPAARSDALHVSAVTYRCVTCPITPDNNKIVFSCSRNRVDVISTTISICLCSGFTAIMDRHGWRGTGWLWFWCLRHQHCCHLPSMSPNVFEERSGRVVMSLKAVPWQDLGHPEVPIVRLARLLLDMPVWYACRCSSPTRRKVTSLWIELQDELHTITHPCSQTFLFIDISIWLNRAHTDLYWPCNRYVLLYWGFLQVPRMCRRYACPWMCELIGWLAMSSKVSSHMHALVVDPRAFFIIKRLTALPPTQQEKY